MYKYLFASILIACSAALPAQSSGFSKGESLYELRTAVFAKEGLRPSQTIFLDVVKYSPDKAQTPLQVSPVFLPKWSVEELPFFCKIEHDFGRKSRIPLKFRLGSVEYVDWLEGK